MSIWYITSGILAGLAILVAILLVRRQDRDADRDDLDQDEWPDIGGLK